jgi:chromosome segregation ATPase
MTKPTGEQPDSIARIAAEIEADVASFESLTTRVDRLELSTYKDIVRAAELLEEATKSHKDFLAHLTRLIQAVDTVRGRQNASAETLSTCATRVDERRKAYEALQVRFASLGTDAHAINQLILDGATTERKTPDAQRESATQLETAHERLTVAVETARSLVDDAKAAAMVDLERQADALRQQLQSLAHKLRHLQVKMGQLPS